MLEGVQVRPPAIKGKHIVSHLLRIVDFEMCPLCILEIDYEKSLLRLPVVLCAKKYENLEERMAIQNPRFSKHVEGALLFLRVSCGYYFLMVFFRVTLDRLSEKGTTCSLV